MEPHLYSCTVEAEPLHRYRPSGYHPVHLGDILKDGQYKILHKLRFGGYSTVWAAKDQKLQRYVAIKIAVSEVGPESHELQVLRTLSASSPMVSSQYVMQLLDDFQLVGPNGTHTCLVFELLGPNIPTVIEAQFPDDLHTGNIAFSMPSLDSLSEEELLEQLQTPRTGIVTRLDGKLIGSGVPKYLVWPSFIPVSEIISTSPIKIIDFGESFANGIKPKTLHTPLAVRAPEVIFEDNWDFRVDLWSVGCMIFGLVTGQPPFDSIMMDKERLICQMIESIGELPEKWWHKLGELMKKEPTEGSGYDLQLWLEELYFDDEKTIDFTRSDIKDLGSSPRKLLRFDPSTRSTALDVLQDDWFRNI